ncbi:hypothetical protein H4Q26_014959 [Puccinia striiformis f. sp. tritici PST-130]|nr:hypothetical protein H4Q26_014959 [Puccinia striiformis f. sp. tritici PST-130]
MLEIRSIDARNDTQLNTVIAVLNTIFLVWSYLLSNKPKTNYFQVILAVNTFVKVNFAGSIYPFRHTFL